MQGRFHPYEGFSHMEAAFPVVVLRNLGVETLIVTNASGAINRDYNAGELMLITDHINFQGDNPLTGIEETDDLTRFPDMTYAYTPDLQRLALEVAEEAGIHLHEGVYVAFRGPSFETPAEIQMAGAWGADAVGMSSVPEVIMARALGMEVLGISCLSNMAAGILPQPLSTEEVMDVAEKVLPTMVNLIRGVARRLAG
jgi:purine-nucleoside phosphorylase